MQYHTLTLALRTSLAAAATLSLAAPAPAYLFWSQPSLRGEPVTGGEPGITLPMPGATPKELRAGLLWAMRAGLNVAALQCQFAPGLQTVSNYNGLLRQHSAELQGAYNSVSAYFKRTNPKGWQTQADQYTTRTYNSFSTLHAQLVFCETAASIGAQALALRPGDLGGLATSRMREFRNSLTPFQDNFSANRGAVNLSPAAFGCYDKKYRMVKCKS